MSSRYRRWLVAVLTAAALVAPLPAVQAAVSVDLGAAPQPLDLASFKLGEFLEELRADPPGLYYEMLLSVDDEAAARAIVPAGRPFRYLPHVGVARTVLDRDEILQVARTSAVEGLEPDRALDLMNAGAREATGVDALQDRRDDGTYGGLTGAGIHVAVIDSGLDTTHPAFSGRIEHAWELVSSDPEIFVPVQHDLPLRGEPVGPRARVYVGSSPSSTRIDAEFKDVSFQDRRVEDAAASVEDLPPTAGTDPSGHGTHVTGTLAAGADGGTDVDPASRGVAPAARIHSYKYAHTVGYGAVTSLVAESFEHILAHNERSPDGDDIRVVNMSLGSPGCGKDPALVRPNQRALRSAFDAGVLVTVAYGNFGPAPATCVLQGLQPWVLAAANGEKGGRLAGDSSRGVVADWANYDRWAAEEHARAYLGADDATRNSWSFESAPIALHRPGVTAPGTRIVSTMGRTNASTQPGAFSAGGGYGMMSGTSMAAPHVAGIATLVVEAYRDAHGVFPSPRTIIEIVEGTADPQVLVTAPVYDTSGAMTSDAEFRLARPHEMGTGYVDAVAAVSAARAWTPDPTLPAREVPKPKWSTSFSLGAECASPVVIGSFVTGKGHRTCPVDVPEGVHVMRIVATPKPGDVVAVSVSEDRCVPCREQSSTISNTSKPVTGKVYDVAVRRPRAGWWTVRFDGTAPGPGAPTAVTPVIPYEAVVSFEFLNRRPTVKLKVTPEAVDRAPVADVHAVVSDPDGIDDVEEVALVISDATGRRTQQYDIDRFVAQGHDLKLDLLDLRLQGVGPWTAHLSARDADGAVADQTVAVGRT